jgi:AraC family transcriptional regulator, transcriptional activator of pobA
METIYRTLQDFFKSINLPLQQNFEMTVHRLKGLHGDGKKQSPLFRTNYYAFLLITGGKSSYTIDGQIFPLQKGSFYFTNPGHLKSFNIEIPLEGYMLTFSEIFIKQNVSGDFFDQFPFLIHETIPVMQLQSAAMKTISDLFEMLLKEYQYQSPYQKAILTNQLFILLYKTKELLQSHKVNIPSSGRSAEIVLQFRTLVNHNFKQLTTGHAEKIWSVKELADKMHLHPNYLTNVIKEETGKAATAWIQEKTAGEAQALLRNSAKPISEIAYQLGFTDSTHFAKFFKKISGSSPLTYRKQAHL